MHRLKIISVPSRLQDGTLAAQGGGKGLFSVERSGDSRVLNILKYTGLHRTEWISIGLN